MIREHTAEVESAIMAAERRSWTRPHAGQSPEVEDGRGMLLMDDSREDKVQEGIERKQAATLGRAEKQRAYWATMSADERKEEMRRRLELAARRRGRADRKLGSGKAPEAAMGQMVSGEQGEKQEAEIGKAEMGEEITRRRGDAEREGRGEELTQRREDAKGGSDKDCLSVGLAEVGYADSLVAGMELTAQVLRDDLAAMERAIAVLRKNRAAWQKGC